MVEDNRYIDRLYSVFDLPQHAELDETAPHGMRKSTRVMMFYDRSKNKRTFQVLNGHLSEKARQRIECWLVKNTQICDAISGLRVSGL